MIEKRCHESHVATLLRDLNEALYNAYVDLIRNLDDVYEDDCGKYQKCGKTLYFFRIEDIISPKILGRIFFGFYNDPLKSSVTFAPAYSPYLDRTLTLKYWGNYHELFHRELFGNSISYVLRFDSDVISRPSGIMDFGNSSPSIINDFEIRKTLGIYWTFSLGLPYDLKNPFLGNLFLRVGDNWISISNIFHTYVTKSNGHIEYLDLNFDRKAIEREDLEPSLDQDYFSYFFIKQYNLYLEAGSPKKRETVKVVGYDSSKFKDIGVNWEHKLVLMALRKMLIQRRLDDEDVINIGNVKEISRCLNTLLQLISKESSIPMKFNVGKMLDEIVEDLGSRMNGREVKVFLKDNNDDIIFVHPALFAKAFVEKEMNEIYDSLIHNVFIDSQKRKKFLRLVGKVVTNKKPTQTHSRNNINVRNVDIIVKYHPDLKQLLGYDKLHPDESIKILDVFKYIFNSIKTLNVNKV
ncbi:hypothetical protein WIW89_01530 [Stygiolobus sp. CP850M]|uniref:hypothetical protein n=1 Tax=Stygiolobus sp. CP850M TaxID=3133134 RepID=UPI00307EB1A5